MSNTMYDGSVIPSNFSQQPMSSAVTQVQHNVVMHVGMVINVIYPDSPKSITKSAHEYDVAVTNMDRDNGLNISIYRNCKMSDRFGSPNNSEVITLVPGQQDGKGGYKQGSIVVLECLGGNSDAGMALIVGGVFNSVVKSYTANDGQVYEFMFNGLQQKVDKNGAWVLSFNSYTDVNGKQSNPAAAGTSISIDKDGKYQLTDNEGQSIMLDRVNKTAVWTNGADSITIDKANKKVELVSSGEMSQTSQKSMNLNSSDGLNASSQSDTSVKSGANMNLQSTGNMSQQANGNWQLTVSGNAQISAGGDVMIQAGGNAQLNGSLVNLGEGGNPVGLVGVSQVLTVVAGVPCIGSLISGSSTVLAGS